MSKKPLPIGIDDFKKIVEGGYYYVDKTFLIKELLDMGGEVNLFTRPRRFGKTLNMSMLRYFFEKSDVINTSLFVDTKIMKEDAKYTAHMGKYPVITVSLKSLKQSTYDNAFYCLKEEIAREYIRHDRIRNNLKYDSEKEKYLRMIEMNAAPEEYLTSIKFLSNCLQQYYKEKVIILIDEYDVPLENSYFNGFYDEMVSLIRSIFESALKSNENLAFAVLTGCLRISRESIFTGLNNLKITSVTSNNYAEHFGFTQKEVDCLLKEYKLEEQRDVIKEWYDGYLFGNVEVYNPWSVINYASDINSKSESVPLPYWSNTSSNSIVRRLIDCSNFATKSEIEQLIEGKTIEKPVHEDITYEDMESTQDNLWNFLFFTGYLKKIEECLIEETRYIKMAIPNNEVRYIYKTMVLRWFEERISEKHFTPLYEAILDKDVTAVEDILSKNLMETISFYDYQESFYHGFVAGILKNMDDYLVLSNRESGNGRPDILLKYPSVRGKAVIIELKVADSYHDLDGKCKEALEQIEERHYDAQLIEEGYRDIVKIGIAFYRKECRVMAKQ